MIVELGKVTEETKDIVLGGNLDQSQYRPHA
jgi:hypothetical protein